MKKVMLSILFIACVLLGIFGLLLFIIGITQGGNIASILVVFLLTIGFVIGAIFSFRASAFFKPKTEIKAQSVSENQADSLEKLEAQKKAQAEEKEKLEAEKAAKKQASKEKLATMRSTFIENNDFVYGLRHAEMICPHCQTKGQVFTKSVKRKKGVSGGKAVGAILTGGLSILATGLSRKEGLTQAHCKNCQATWDF